MATLTEEKPILLQMNGEQVEINRRLYQIIKLVLGEDFIRDSDAGEAYITWKGSSVQAKVSKLLRY